MNLVVAVDKNWGIGYKGTQTVVVPEDRVHFREITTGGTVIVGRRTLADFPGGKPLKNRTNIVMTRNRDFSVPGAETASSLEELFSMTEGVDPGKLFVIGGDSVYKLLLPYCTYAYVTKIYAEPEADRFIENLDESPDWEIVESSPVKEYDGVSYAFITYRNNCVRPMKERTPD